RPAPRWRWSRGWPWGWSASCADARRPRARRAGADRAGRRARVAALARAGAPCRGPAACRAAARSGSGPSGPVAPGDSGRRWGGGVRKPDGRADDDPGRAGRRDPWSRDRRPGRTLPGAFISADSESPPSWSEREGRFLLRELRGDGTFKLTVCDPAGHTVLVSD